MTAPHYSVLGLGRARSLWLGAMSSWTTTGALPASFTKCVSPAEVHQRLASLQPWSVLLLEDTLARAHGDILEAANRRNIAVFVIGGEMESAVACLPFDFSPTQLLSAMAAHASVLHSQSEDVDEEIEELTAWRGRLISVCGPGGSGASAVAMAVAQGLGRDSVDSGSVVLCDFTRNAELAMLHDVVLPTSVEDLVAANRLRVAASDEVRGLTSALEGRGYSLLGGMLKSSAWSTMTSRAIDNSTDSLRRSFLNVVTDLTADFEGEDSGGSMDVEERNALSRQTVLRSDVVIVVGRPGVKGTYSTARVIRELLSLGVEASRIATICNSAPKSPLTRASITKALAAIIDAPDLAGPGFLGEFDINAATHDGQPMPKKFVTGVSHIVQTYLRTVPQHGEVTEPIAITPGTLGDFGERAS